MRKAVLASLIGIAVAGAAVAQEDNASTLATPGDVVRQDVDSPARTDGPIREQSLSGQAADDTANGTDLASLDPAELEGKPIFNTDGEEVGDVDAIKVEKATQEKVAIVGIKGVVGDEMKEVAIPLAELSMASNGEGLETQLSKADLEGRSDIDPMDEAYVDVDEFEEAE